MDSTIFDSYYYSHDCGRPYQRDESWLTFFDIIAKRIIEQFNPKSVLDAGCAWGFLVESFRKRGVEASGIDISEYAIENVHPDIKEYCLVRSIIEPLENKYDLITCIEVLEHMSKKDAEIAIENMCSHAEAVIFSSTPFDFKEVTHINVHEPDYWAEQFARYGFFRDMDADVSCITPWAVKFEKKKQTILKIIKDYERNIWQYRKENADLRQSSFEMQDKLRNLDEQIKINAELKQSSFEMQEKLRTLDEQIKINAEIKQLTFEMQEQLRNLDEQIKINAENELSLVELTSQLIEKDQSLKALEIQLSEIECSKAWKVALLLRKIRVKLIPNGSRSYKIAGYFYKSLRLLQRKGYRALKFRIKNRIHRNKQNADVYQKWILTNEPHQRVLADQREHAKDFNYLPLISVILPVWNPPPQILEKAIKSVVDQTYPNWELCIADGDSNPGTKEVILRWVDKETRIKAIYLDENKGISGNSNEAIKLAKGDFIALLDHDDLLAPNMLFEIVSTLNRFPDADIIYFDEDKISEDGKIRRDPWFKPQRWSPDLLLSVNYLMHAVFRRTLVEGVGGFDPRMDGAQDWDLALRCTEITHRIIPIPKILYHWRQLPGSAALTADAKPWAFDSQIRCIQGHLQRLKVNDFKVISPSLGQVRVIWPVSGGKVSIIIPTKDKIELLKPCLESILNLTSYSNYEIILVDTGSADAITYQYYQELSKETRIRIINFNGPFNFSEVNNFGVTHATGDFLLFLNNDTQILCADWLDELVGWVERKEVGLVGCKLIRPDGIIQHAGIIMGLEGHGSHVFEGNAEDCYGPYGSSEWYRDYFAVTGACAMIRREVFDQVGGFDLAYQVGYGDIDLCLRVEKEGYRVIYTPFTRVLHHEGATRGLYLPLSDVLLASCRMFSIIQNGDPFFNPNLSYNHRRIAIVEEGEESRIDRLYRILSQFNLVNAGNLQVNATPSLLLPENKQFLDSEHNRDLLLVSHDLSLSGASLILYTLAIYLAKNGFSITVVSPRNGPLFEIYLKENIKVIIEPTLLDDARISASLLVEQGLVIANTVLTWRAVYAAKALQKPCVWWIHEGAYGKQLASNNQQLADAFSLAEKVVFPSNTTAALYSQFLKSDNSVCIYHGLDVQFPEDLPEVTKKESGKFNVVVIGSIETRKGQDILLNSLLRLSSDIRSQFDVYLVGRVLERGFYTDLLRKFKGWKNVHFVGEVSHEKALAYLQAADVFVLPSRDEVLPITLLEAMAYGKGIIISRVGGASEVIEQNTNGLLFDVSDEKCLAQSLELFFNDREMLTKMGKQAQIDFKDKFSLARFGKEFSQLLQELQKSR